MKIVRWSWRGLTFATLPFLAQSSYEMIILTYLNGPQLVFFALTHGAYGDIWGNIVIISYLLFMLCIPLSLAVLAYRKWGQKPIFSTIDVVVSLSVIAYAAFAILYDCWERSLVSSSTY